MFLKRRHSDAPSDEQRLFPTYSRNQRNEVAITPGEAPRKRGKISQSHSILKPVDTLSRKARDSGSVRAHGKSRYVSDSQTSPFPRNAQLNSPTNFDDSERPPKRQRLVPSPMHTNVINLVDDEDLQVIPSASVLSPENRHEYRPSSATPSQTSAKVRKAPESKNDVDEYREVERLVTRPWRKYNNDSSPKKQTSIPDSRGASPQYTRQKRNGSPFIELRAPERLEQQPKHPIFDSVEVYPPKNESSTKNLRNTTLQRQFIPTDGKRRTSDMRESPDELQGDATVQPAPSSLDTNSRKDLTPDSRSAGRSRKGVGKSARYTSPSDIPPTIFSSPRQGQKKSQHKSRQVTKGRSHLHIFEASLFRFGSVEKTASHDRGFDIIFDDGNETIGIVISEGDEAQNATIPVRKVAQALQGEDESRKVQLRLSKTEGSYDEKIDIEFQCEKDKGDLCNLLEIKGVKLQYKESKWMDKLFENSRKNKPRQDKRVKRPSSENTQNSPAESKVELSKRQKLSTSLQDEDGIATAETESTLKKPPCRLQNSPRSISPDASTRRPPVSKEVESGVTIPVKKIYSPAERRETCSKTRSGMVSLIDDVPISPTELTSNDGLPKCSRSLVYPREGKRKAEVDYDDFERLRDGEFLNDNLIGFYLRFLEHHLERTSPDVSRRVYFFNSYFYATLTNLAKGKRGINYEGVQKWTRNVDLFSHDYVIVPINESEHWYLAIICNLTSLQPTHEDGEIVTSAFRQDAVSQPMSEVNDEIPETPQSVPDDTKTADEAGQSPLKTNTEESARESFASMTLSESASAEGSQELNISKDQGHNSDDDWPANEENPMSSPPKFSNSREASHLTEDKQVEKTKVEQSKEIPAPPKEQKERDRFVRKDDSKQPYIITFDSLGASRSPAVRVLRLYLLEEAKCKRSLELDGKDIKGMMAREIPLQSNFSDCGLYLLAYLEKFVEDPNLFVEGLLQKKMSAEDWPPLKSGLLRRRLREFLYRLQDEQENTTPGKEEKTLVDEKPLSFLLGSALAVVEPNEDDEYREETIVPDSQPNEVVKKDSSSNRIAGPVEPKVNTVRETRSSSRRGEIGQYRSGETSPGKGNTSTGQMTKQPEVVTTEKQHHMEQPDIFEIEDKSDSAQRTRSRTPELAVSQTEITHGLSMSTYLDSIPRSPTRLARKAKDEDLRNVTTHESQRHTDDLFFDDLWEMTAPNVRIEVQIPGTPPSNSRSEIVRESPRSSPRQTKPRNKDQRGG